MVHPPPPFEAPARSSAPSGRRSTLAVLADYMDLFGGGYELELREALERECRARDLDLLLVYGGALSPPDGSLRAHNNVYDLMDPARVDALITISAGLSTHTGTPGLERLLEHCRVRARCSAGALVSAAPSIVVDNAAGMRALMDHLIAHHGYRRIAFIGGTRGNIDADARLAAYREGLARAGIAYDPALVVTGDFIRRSGELAALELMRPGPLPDAMVVANDGMALGAIAALQRSGRSVPSDVAVTGFDDLAMARLGDPPLTTIAQPLGAMMVRAIDIVQAQLLGEPVAEVVHLPAELVVRDSCGCAGRLRRSIAPSSAPAPPSPRAFFELHAERIARRLKGHGQMRRPASQQDMRRLHEAMSRELAREAPGLLPAVQELLQLIGDDNERREALQIGVALLRDELRPVLDLQLDDLFHDAQALITLTDRRVQVQQRLEIDQAYSLLMEKGEQFSNALDHAGLRAGLERALPTLGMNTAFISLQSEERAGELVPLLCLIDGKPAPVATESFPAHLLIPPGALGGERRKTLLVFPLIKSNRCLGIAVFEYTPGNNGYVVVRDRVAVALAGVELHQAIVRSATAVERTIQEQQRIASEERIRALSVLAGGVAHDLNNAIGPLVALPDVMLEELVELAQHAPRACMTLRTDLESIKSAALRASQTIKDLLASSRQGQAKKDPLDLNRALQDVVSRVTMHAVRSSERLQVTFRLHRAPLSVLASETHVERAISNLVHNAIEAMDQRGQLIVTTSEREVGAAEAEQHGVRPGRFAVLEVHDTGRGIAASDLPRIFEPFFSSKRLSERSGSGLGLAIVDGVVKDHDGFVQVRSTVGQGSTFTLHFPLSEATGARSQEKPPPLAGKGRILVVDDDPVQLRTATRLLEHFGYDVDAVSTGARAYEHFARHKGRCGNAASSPYDLVIVDVELNEAEDGLALCRRIRELFPLQTAIVASGRAPCADAELGPRLAWLSKPYTADVLARSVREAITHPSGFPAPHSSKRPGGERT